MSNDLTDRSTRSAPQCIDGAQLWNLPFDVVIWVGLPLAEQARLGFQVRALTTSLSEREGYEEDSRHSRGGNSYWLQHRGLRFRIKRAVLKWFAKYMVVWS